MSANRIRTLLRFQAPRPTPTTSRFPTMTSPYKCTALPRSLYPTTIAHSPHDLRRQDEGPDAEWYAQPRFVQHIDAGAITALKSYYGAIVKPSHSVLDLCSSWVSHLPDALKPLSLVGYGMNRQELERNGHLTRFYVRDLNRSPSLEEVESESVDVLVCNVSVDYLTQPVEVFKEMNRVLRVGGTAHMAFSNRCFPTKVVGRWVRMNDEQRRRWVGGYFWASGGWEGVEECILKEGTSGIWNEGEDPLFIVRARKAAAAG